MAPDWAHPDWPLLLKIAAAWTFVDGIHACWALATYPETFTVAYQLVRDIAPVEVWAATWLVGPALVAAGWLARRPWHVSMGLLIYAGLCIVFGLSIMSLVLDGTAPGAWIGAGKWIGVGIFAASVAHVEGAEAIDGD